jgi:hypothetical protein
MNTLSLYSITVFLFIKSYCIFYQGSFYTKSIYDNSKQIDGKQKPRRYKLSKYKFELRDTSKLSINAAYLFKFPPFPGSNKFPYSFIRFFKDGKCYWSKVYDSFPTKANFNDYNNGEFGRYILKDSLLVIELYTKLEEVIYSDVFFFGNLSSNSLVIYKMGSNPSINSLDINRKRLKPPQVYEKYFY